MESDDLDSPTKDTLLRLGSSKTTGVNRRARWELVLTKWEQGVSAEEIGKWIARAPSTVIRLVKRAALERQKQPGFKWPLDSTGKKICDVANPMPGNEDPRLWAHARIRQKKFGRKIIGQPPQPARVGYCPCCCKGGLLHKPVFFTGKPLVKVFNSKKTAKPHENKHHQTILI